MILCSQLSVGRGNLKKKEKVMFVHAIDFRVFVTYKFNGGDSF